MTVSDDGDSVAIASGAGPGILEIWHRNSKAWVKRWSMQMANNCPPAFSADGQLVAVGEGENTVRIRDVASGRDRNVVKVTTLRSARMALSPDGRTFAFQAVGRLTTWSLEAGMPVVDLELRMRPDQVAFLPDGSALVVAGWTRMKPQAKAVDPMEQYQVVQLSAPRVGSAPLRRRTSPAESQGASPKSRVPISSCRCSSKRWCCMGIRLHADPELAAGKIPLRNRVRSGIATCLVGRGKASTVRGRLAMSELLIDITGQYGPVVAEGISDLWELRMAKSKSGGAFAPIVTGGRRRDISPEPLAIESIDDPVIATVLRGVRESVGRPVTVTALRALSHMSRRRLEQRFRTLLGCSPMQAIRRVNLERAATMLVETTLSIKEIAKHCCFGRAIHLTVAFKKHFGVPPSQFRNRHRCRSSLPSHDGRPPRKAS